MQEEKIIVHDAVPEINMQLCYSIDTLTQVLPIGRSLVEQLVRSKGFPSIKVGNRIIIPKKVFERWLEDKAFECK